MEIYLHFNVHNMTYYPGNVTYYLGNVTYYPGNVTYYLGNVTYYPGNVTYYLGNVTYYPGNGKCNLLPGKYGRLKLDIANSCN